MCGILGIIGKINPSILELLSNFIEHRGPESKGFYSYDTISLVHSRLSIQDLSDAGAQPMISDDGRYTLIYNGEIYNHLEIRRSLTSGINYKGHSDTETLLNAWILHGKSILPQLNGFFAFAIFDKVTHSLTLARDRFGIKPLYYYNSPTNFAFASELKALKDFPGHNKTIDFTAISDYLTLLYTTGDKTPFQNIKKLLPGHYLEINTKTLEIGKLQNFITDNKAPINILKSEKEWLDTLEFHLSQAVKRQLLSDVPVGYFLSGGLDSSSIASFARKQLGNITPLEAFTLDSRGFSKNEGFAEDIDYAKKVAKQLNINLNIIPSSINLLENFDEMVWQLDEPMADAAALNINILCKAAHEKGFKVLMSGTGADELLGGYRRHQTLSLEPTLAMMPGILKTGLSKLGKLIPAANPTLRRSKKLLNTFAMDKEERLISYHDWLNYSSILELFHKDISKELKKHYHPHIYFRDFIRDNQPFSSDLELMLAIERATYLPDDGLLYTDKMSMLHGVEVRVPFLDNELVDFASQIPSHFKIKRNTTKYLLKKLMESYLPNEIIYRSKTGFGAPVRSWVKNNLHEKINDYLSVDSLNSRGIFNPDKVRKLIIDNNAGKIDASYSIWALLAIESWMRQFADE